MDDDAMKAEAPKIMAGLFGLLASTWLGNYFWYRATSYPYPYCKIQQLAYPIFSQVWEGASALAFLWVLAMGLLVRTGPLLFGCGLIMLLHLAPGFIQTLYGFEVPCWPYSPQRAEFLNWLHRDSLAAAGRVGG